VQGEVEVPAQLSGRLPPLSGGDRTVLAVFLLTAAAWIFREPKDMGGLRIPGLADVVPGITDPGIAVAAGILLMALPLRGQRFATPLDWETARRIPWGVLLLFGGGLALAGAFETSGLSGAIGGALAGLQGVPYPVLLAATIALFVTLTELTSNTATAALGLPLIVGVANGLGLPAWPLMVAVALSCSMAFMLPVATPPNAIAYGSGALTVREMARAGWRLNILSVGVILVITLCLS
jgi:sodium-dependent dicarboxylate transporter 2/3/5